MPTLLSLNNYHYLRGGAETVFFEHNRLFAEQGWEVVPFSMHHPKNLPTPWAEYFVDEIELGADYSRWQQLTRVPKVIYSLEARRKLDRLLARVAPDICHAHNIYHHLSPSVLGLLKQRSVPVVMTLHDLKIACPAYNMLAPDGICERCRGGRLYQVAVHRCLKGSAAFSAIAMVEAYLHRLIGSYRRCVDRFVVPSQFYIDKLCEWGWPRANFRHVPNFVDARRYRPQYSPGKPFLYFGRISPEKGLETLVRAAAAARVPVRIVGTGPQLDELRALAASISADVHFDGYLTGESLHDAIRAARAVVIPSEWYENAPMSVLESFALGKPVIGARIGGITELVREGETGTVFASGDVDSLSDTLRRIADTADAPLADLGRSARRWVESSRSAEVYLQQIKDIYQQLGVSCPTGPRQVHA